MVPNVSPVHFSAFHRSNWDRSFPTRASTLTPTSGICHATVTDAGLSPLRTSEVKMVEGVTCLCGQTVKNNNSCANIWTWVWEIYHLESDATKHPSKPPLGKTSWFLISTRTGLNCSHSSFINFSSSFVWVKEVYLTRCYPKATAKREWPRDHFFSLSYIQTPNRPIASSNRYMPWVAALLVMSEERRWSEGWTRPGSAPYSSGQRDSGQLAQREHSRPEQVTLFSSRLLACGFVLPSATPAL